MLAWFLRVPGFALAGDLRAPQSSAVAMETLERRVLLTAITSGERVIGEIFTETDTDSYTFSANAGDTVLLSLGELHTWRSRLDIFAPDGTAVASATSSSTVSAERNMQIELLNVAQVGTYAAVVSGVGTSTGEYALSLAKLPGPQPFTLGPLISGERVTGTLGRGDFGIYSFTADAGDSVLFTMGELNTWDSRLDIFAPDGTRLDWARSGNTVSSVRNMQIELLDLEQSGTYYALVRAGRWDTQGDYALTMMRRPGPQPHDLGPLVSGERVTGTIDRGDFGIYSFTADAGDSVLFTMGELNTWDSRLDIFAPDGTRLDWARSGNTVSSVRNMQIELLDLEQGGTYYALVRAGRWDTQGDYALTMMRRPGPQPHDLGPLVSGERITGTLGRGEFGIYSFTADAGDSVLLTMGELNTWQSRLDIFAPDGTRLDSVLGSVSVSAVRNMQIELLDLEHSGTYYALVRAGHRDSQGDYALTMMRRPGPQPHDLGPLISGERITGTLGRGDFGIYSFTADAGDSVLLTMGELNTWQSRLDIFAPDGTRLDSVLGSVSVSAVRNMQIELLDLEQSGTYYALVRAGHRDSQGNYALTMLRLPQAQPHDLGPLVSGERRLGTITRGDFDIYTFTANAGDSLLFSLGELHSWQSRLDIFAPDGTRLNWIGSSSTVSTGANVQMTLLDVEHSGTYYAVVRSGHRDSTGDYALSMARVAGPQATTSLDNDGGPISSGQTRSGAISAGDLDVYTISVSSGSDVLIQMQRLTGSYTPRLDMFAPDGTRLAFHSGTTATINLESAPQTGTYYIVARSNTVSGVGNYSIAVNTTPGPDARPPEVTQAMFEFQTRQRIAIMMNESVAGSVQVSDLVLENLTEGFIVPSANLNVTFNTLSNQIIYTFPGYPGQVLPNGNYRATLPAGSVQDTAGNPLPADHVFDFFVLAGDANRDRRVDGEDFLIWQANFGTSFEGRVSIGDFNYDGRVDGEDFLIWQANFGAHLPPPAPPAAAQAELSTANIAVESSSVQVQDGTSAPLAAEDALFAATGFEDGVLLSPQPALDFLTNLGTPSGMSMGGTLNDANLVYINHQDWNEFFGAQDDMFVQGFHRQTKQAQLPRLVSDTALQPGTLSTLTAGMAGQLQLGSLFGNPVMGRAGDLLHLKANGQLMLLRPPAVSGGSWLSTTLANLRNLPIDRTAVYDVATGQTFNATFDISTALAEYNDVAAYAGDGFTDVFITALSGVHPFVTRLRFVDGNLTQARVIVTTSVVQQTVFISGFGNWTPKRSSGVAVNDRGMVLTTIATPTGVPGQGLPRVVAFGAGFPEGNGPNPHQVFDLPLAARGITTNVTGDFILTSVPEEAGRQQFEFALVSRDLSNLFIQPFSNVDSLARRNIPLVGETVVGAAVGQSAVAHGENGVLISTNLGGSLQNPNRRILEGMYFIPDLVPNALTQPTISVYTDGGGEITAADEVLVDFGVSNIGTGATGLFTVELLLDGEQVFLDTVANLPSPLGSLPDSMRLYTGQSLGQLAPGTYELKLMVDRLDFVKELDESNNVRTTTFEVVGGAGPGGDAYEPNASFDTAHDLGTFARFADTGLTIHAPGNDDYFRFTAPGDGTVNVSIFFSHAAGDLDLHLYDADRVALVRSISTNDDETISAPVSAGESYFVRVNGFDGATNEYDIEIAVADKYEPNSTRESAYDLGILTDFFDTGLTLHQPGDEDWFRFTAGADGQLTASIFFTRGDGDLFLVLFDEDGDVEAQYSMPPDEDRGVAPVSAGRTYFLAVDTWTGVATNVYDLKINILADTVAPEVVAAEFDHLDASHPVRFSFSKDVSGGLAAADLVLENLTTGTVIDPADIALTYDSSNDSATFTFPGLPNGSLSDGVYRATLPADSVQDAAGNALLADHVFDFFVLAGDANRDRRVDGEDFLIWQASFGTSSGAVLSMGDFNYDRRVDGEDFLIWQANFGRELPPPAPPAAAEAAAADEVVAEVQAATSLNEVASASGHMPSPPTEPRGRGLFITPPHSAAANRAPRLPFAERLLSHQNGHAAALVQLLHDDDDLRWSAQGRLFVALPLLRPV